MYNIQYIVHILLIMHIKVDTKDFYYNYLIKRRLYSNYR
jgi:hypothetical protein